MKTTLFLRLFVIGLLLIGVPKVYGQLSIIPAPQKQTIQDGQFTFDGRIGLQADAELKSVPAYLSREFEGRFGISLTEESSVDRSIVLQVDESLLADEAYQLQVMSDEIIITGGAAHGVFNGIQSLMQLVYTASEDNRPLTIRSCTIEDAPRFEWRGFMLDESRHFFGKEKVKQLLDLMALHKINTFHWHLTDEPGWRVEIKEYPKLTTIGGKGTWSNPDTPAQFYTQKDIREIVNYAKKRFIKVIPEIDMPGHASAANRAYPEFSGGGSEDHPEFTFHPGRESTYDYLTNILREIATLFPSSYVHIGGDEVHYGNQEWAADEEIQQLMHEQNLEDLKTVESYFIRRMADSVKAMGSKVVGWDEVASAGVSKDSSVVMWWHHDKPEILDEVLQQGYTTVLCPRIPMYFDFVQHDSHQSGRRWNGFSDLRSVYGFPSKLSINDEVFGDQILGIQANLWTERVQNEERLDFMVWPRLSAMAEAAWTPADSKSYEGFQQRLKGMLEILDKYQISYFNPFDIKSTPEPKGTNTPRWQENF
ncbi:beta-N-acetylhexosaminidase [Fodinibius salsisoli]|uniref:beta-N-acetylhexosaminidase n=1 Tax=Fodinibius salsisoli TaxID=2820877 RepID=A0ABT3PQ62_9BACT|nr:beta-N-acetylhexosaminidase [Fodinibius salsisoli]MCW9707992.1 beta-N-acetylhexosaminidase [Fodinibius salsisoli]